MLFVDNLSVTDPAINLALEEHLARNVQIGEDILLFFINEPSIIIGRHQNTIEEINRDYVEDHGIHVVRRLSGGGAVYHDLGNLNYSFITPYRKEDFNNFQKFTSPLITVLHKIGVSAELSGRNDILVDGKKISGSAQFISTQRMISHGTLLFNSDLSCVGEALNVKSEKISSKGIKSVRSRVTNICEFMTDAIDISEFRFLLLREIINHIDPVPQYRLRDDELNSVLTLAQERYRNWDWNYGHSPEYNIQKSHRFPFGEIDAHIDVQNGLIKSLKIFGDFFAEEELSYLEIALTGVRYARAEIMDAIPGEDVGGYFKGLTKDDFVNFLY